MPWCRRCNRRTWVKPDPVTSYSTGAIASAVITTSVTIRNISLIKKVPKQCSPYTVNYSLFTYVNESLFARNTYDTLIRIHNSTFFDPEVCHDENTTGLKTALQHHFIDLVTNTAVFQLAYEYLRTHGKRLISCWLNYVVPFSGVTSGDQATFVQTLYNLWFGTYSRCSPHLGSSGESHPVIIINFHRI